MKQSFFERITGTVSLKNNKNGGDLIPEENTGSAHSWASDEPVDGELSVDVYQTDEAIVIQAMVAGVPAEDLSISVTRELVTIKGERGAPAGIAGENYFYKELYWGAFSRTILLPQEIETEEVTATERHGLLTITLPKIDKAKVQKVKIKSL
ncbi:MAG: Protein containing Heat shock protein Hsp20 protein [Parcubacteria group bacterium GW2011_GWA2_49_16]|nr:MAG: Protein containing Heat shock protein Hsp20 protein [Parcubacteria group bacterium GW2011_GWB1_44_7]KKW07877.1 MAG: Protein containing Heat shock protein Hsp20 protein [Parcubacteria group bacterium GW2011_GWA2_49_16]